ncbi:phosphotransferase [Sulfurimonas sp.]|uniref:phosphotransferase n=1 Tax=Sulfurimonas sp. TaxID=2022749 RepID=UPI002B477F36|nr:phosphotransferase [Sulfurimonas sp.]
MGVKSKISLDAINKLFESYDFVKLTPTTSGIIDTTYIVHTKNDSYILKKYERDILQKITLDAKLLKTLKASGLNVPLMLDKKDEWYLYERLKGDEPKNIKAYHLQELARFFAKMHLISSKNRCNIENTFKNEIKEALDYAKNNYFFYYKKFEFLKDFTPKNDGIIHGDIFKDNTVFDGRKIGVFDFIDSSCGSFIFDAAVGLIGFDIKQDNNYAINIFLKTYNQRTIKKIDKNILIKNMKNASHFFALKRVYEYKNTNKAKELL